MSDSEHILFEFLDAAKPVFYEAVREFESSVKRLNRNSEEYRFNELKDQHVVSLKRKLEEAAKDFISTHQHHKQLSGLDQRIQQIIKDYLHEFVLRTRSL